MKSPRTLIPYTLTLVAFLCIAALILTQHPEQLFGARYDIRIVNGLNNNSSLALVIWCGTGSSEEADMGGRALQEGDDYSWALQTLGWPVLNWAWPNQEEGEGGPIRSDDVCCTVKWDLKRKSFFAFMESRDSQRCGVFGMCLWLVKEDGFYFSNDGYAYHKEFDWP